MRRKDNLSPGARLARRWILRWFDRSGWDVEGVAPAARKMIIMGAPHTSNWDFPVFYGTVRKFGLEPRFMGKTSLFRWPFRRLFLGLGGIPVDRGSSTDMVAQMARVIAECDDFALVIAAEGTRDPTSRWRTGHYRIAHAAGVPIQCAGPDYPRKRAIFGPLIMPTGDYDADMIPAWEFFRTTVPLHPQRVLFPDGFGMDGPPREG